MVGITSTHIAGGTIMGADKSTSVVNPYLQHWDVDNLFVVGTGNFPHNPGYNLTLALNALAYRASEAIIKYLKLVIANTVIKFQALSLEFN